MSYSSLGQAAPQCADPNAESQGKSTCVCVAPYVCAGPLVMGWGCLAGCVAKGTSTGAGKGSWAKLAKKACEESGNLWDVETSACYPVLPDEDPSEPPRQVPNAPPLSMPYPQGGLPPPPPPPIVEPGPGATTASMSGLGMGAALAVGSVAGIAFVAWFFRGGKR